MKRKTEKNKVPRVDRKPIIIYKHEIRKEKVCRKMIK